MLTRILPPLSLVLLSVAYVQAQQAPAPVEPDFEAVFMLLDSTAQRLSGLERQTPRRRTSKPLVGGAKSVLEISGDRSPVRLPATGLPQFVVRVPNRAGDPYGLLQFFAVKVDGNKRSLTVAEQTAFHGVVSGFKKEQLVSFDVALYGAASYKVVPTSPLPPGEYCLSLATSDQAFCFGVDGPPGR